MDLYDELKQAIGEAAATPEMTLEDAIRPLLNAINTLFERDYYRVYAAEMDGKFADEQEFQRALNQVYATYDKTPPKHRRIKTS